MTYLGYYYVPTSISTTDTNTYVLDNNAGKRITYSFAGDTVLNVNNYPFQVTYQKDTLLCINQETLLMTDNVYNISKGGKTPLIPSRTVFEEANGSSFCNRILGDKMIFRKLNAVSGRNEIWCGTEEMHDLQLIAELAGYFRYDSNQIWERNGKLYFYTDGNPGKTAFYETDGTKEGTKKIYETSESASVNTAYIKMNSGYMVFRFVHDYHKENILILENGKMRLADFLVGKGYETYLTDTDICVSVQNEDIYELHIVVGNELKLIDKQSRPVNRRIQWVSTYKDRILYVKIANTQSNEYGLFTMDEAKKPTRFLEENINDYNIVGSKLVFKQRIIDELVFSVLNLPDNQLEVGKHTGAHYSNNYYYYDRL